MKLISNFQPQIEQSPLYRNYTFMGIFDCSNRAAMWIEKLTAYLQ